MKWYLNSHLNWQGIDFDVKQETEVDIIKRYMGINKETLVNGG